MGMKCQKCGHKKKVLYEWFGFKLCNPCITETLILMGKAGVSFDPFRLRA